MANFTALKTAINNAIKTNGNEEITGAILQAILDAMVETLGDSAITDLENAITTEVTNRENAVGGVVDDLNAEVQARQALDYNVNNRINAEEYNRQNADAALSQTMSQGFQTLGSQMTALNAAISALNAAYQNGYLYGGIATPSSSPSNNKCFYIALQGGTYTNFGGVGVVEGINIIKNDSGWKVEHIYDQTTLLNEFYLLRQQVIQAIASFTPIVIEGDVTNAPDEEDLTSNANHLLQFKNNVYSPLEFSGLGRKYLRKNIAPLSESAPFNGFVEGVTAEETLSGTPTHIFWDRMNTRFVGIKDGIYYAAWTDDDNYVPVSTSLVYMYNGTPYQWTGSDFIVDETEMPNLVNCLTQDMINEANTIYVIRYDYTLKEDITIPANCVLKFDGGSISGNNLVCNDTLIIEAENSLNVLISGSVKNDSLCCSTFGINPENSSKINTERIQAILNLNNNNQYKHFTVYFDWYGDILVNDTIIIPARTSIIGSGFHRTNIIKNRDAEKEIDAVLYGEGDYINIDNIRSFNIENGAVYAIYLKMWYKSTLSNIAISGYEYGIYVHVGWLTEIRDILCQACEYGLYLNGGTSFNCKRVYINLQKQIGISGSNLQYSEFYNCANDHGSGGTAYAFSNSQVTFISCAAESSLPYYYSFDRCQATIIGGNLQTYANYPEGYTPTGHEALFVTMSSNVFVNGVKFGTATYKSKQAILYDWTNSRYKPSVIIFGSNNYDDEYKSPIIADSDVAPIIEGLNNEPTVISKYTDVYLGNKQKKVILNKTLSQLSSTAKRTDGIGNVYLPLNADEKEVFATVVLDGTPRVLGTIATVQSENNNFIVSLRLALSNRNDDTVLSCTKSNRYVLGLGSNKYCFANSIAKTDTIESTNVIITIPQSDGITPIVGDVVTAYKYGTLNSPYNLSEQSTYYEIIFTSLFNDTIKTIPTQSTIIGVKEGETTFVASSIKTVNYTSRTIEVNKSAIVQGEPLQSMNYYVFLNTTTLNSAVKRAVPYIICDNIYSILRKNELGFYNDGQFIFSFGSGSYGISTVRDGNMYFAPTYKTDTKFKGSTSQRPTGVPAGTFFHDETLGKPIWYNGTAWVDATGTPV